ncbi:MAG: putative sulfurtransferase, partial [Porticoccaceae bacterium]
MQDTPIINISGYRFVHLNDLPDLQARLKSSLAEFDMQGSIMLASEGINVSL